MKPVSLFLMVLTAAAFCSCQGKSRTVQDFGADIFTGELSGKITVSAYDSMTYRSFLEEAARSFEAAYPGTTVTIETFSAMPEIRRSEDGDRQMIMVQSQDDPNGRADYISRVNTGLMSGEGADLYAMDVLPLHKLVEGGQLENLETFMDGDPDFNKVDYRGNILEALRYHEGIWFLPMDYTFNYFAYDSTLVPEAAALTFGTEKAWTSSELLAIGEQYYNGSARIFNLPDYTYAVSPAGNFARQVLDENMQTFVDLEHKKVNFVNGGFAGLLESVKLTGERGYVTKGVAGGTEEPRALLVQAGAEENTRFFFKLRSNFSLASHFSRGTGRRIMTEAGGEVRDLAEEIAGIAADSGGSVPFEYSQGYGINSGSKNKALAWAFIKFLLSEEMQLSTALRFSVLPINNEARKQKAELIFSGALSGREVAIDATMEAALKKYIAVTEELSDKINFFPVRDTTINDMITAELHYFFSGSKSTSEVAAVLQNKAGLYLNE